TVSGYYYLLGSQKVSSGVRSIDLVPGGMFVGLDNGLLMKFSGTGGAGNNMLAVSESGGTVTGLAGYSYWQGTQQFAARVTALVYSAADNTTTVGLSDGRMLKVAGTGGGGQNMFAVSPTDYGFATVSGYNYLLGSQKFSSGVGGLYQ